jgi:thiamine-phosphate pyrophosphorylase
VTPDPSRPLVYLVTSGECEPDNFETSSARLIATVSAAVDAGVDLVQLREKRLSGRLLFDLTERLAELVRGSGTKLLVNDRFDIAMAAGADGVHLTSTSMRPAVVRRCVPDSFLIGVSVHIGDELNVAGDGADLAVFGPVFATPGKGDGVALKALSTACSVSQIPVIAIGGIDENNYRDVLGAGAAGFAAIRALNDTASMQRILREVSQ